MKEMRVSALNKAGKKIAFHNYFQGLDFKIYILLKAEA